MKKCRIFVLFTVIILCGIFSISPAFSAENCDIVVSLQVDNPIMEVNGEDMEIDLGRGTTPIIRDGRTLVPIRAIIEEFDGKVGWDDPTKTATLTLEDDIIKLTINSNTAYLNGVAYTLDVSPVIHMGRTMLPIRFVAEGFNLGVAWEDRTKTVSVIRNGLDDSEYKYLQNNVPAYSGKPYVSINDNKPMFKDYEIIEGSFEFYGNLDELNRCDVCMASIAEDIMPTGERESISSVTPTGWINKKYDVVNGGYLYNRCHLIGYQLTGENANRRNLITGTRHLNIDGMLSFENMIDDYIEKTGNRVIYRVTPFFEEDNLLASGVLLEAYSVEDGGAGISFCVYCYNVQPGIYIDYSTGDSSISKVAPEYKEDTENTGGVYRTPSGKKYHFDPECGGKNSYQTTLSDAEKAGLTPCSKCAK